MTLGIITENNDALMSTATGLQDLAATQYQTNDMFHQIWDGAQGNAYTGTILRDMQTVNPYEQYHSSDSGQPYFAIGQHKYKHTEGETYNEFLARNNDRVTTHDEFLEQVQGRPIPYSENMTKRRAQDLIGHYDTQQGRSFYMETGSGAAWVGELLAAGADPSFYIPIVGQLGAISVTGRVAARAMQLAGAGTPAYKAIKRSLRIKRQWNRAFDKVGKEGYARSFLEGAAFNAIDAPINTMIFEHAFAGHRRNVFGDDVDSESMIGSMINASIFGGALGGVFGAGSRLLRRAGRSVSAGGIDNYKTKTDTLKSLTTSEFTTAAANLTGDQAKIIEAAKFDPIQNTNTIGRFGYTVAAREALGDVVNKAFVEPINTARRAAKAARIDDVEGTVRETMERVDREYFYTQEGARRDIADYEENYKQLEENVASAEKRLDQLEKGDASPEQVDEARAVLEDEITARDELAADKVAADKTLEEGMTLPQRAQEAEIRREIEASNANFDKKGVHTAGEHILPRGDLKADDFIGDEIPTLDTNPKEAPPNVREEGVPEFGKNVDQDLKNVGVSEDGSTPELDHQRDLLDEAGAMDPEAKAEYAAAEKQMEDIRLEEELMDETTLPEECSIAA